VLFHHAGPAPESDLFVHLLFRARNRHDESIEIINSLEIGQESVTGNPFLKREKTQVLIIGGGITGTGLALDLARQGVQTVLVEHFDMNAGASGSNRVLLHSVAR